MDTIVASIRQAISKAPISFVWFVPRSTLYLFEQKRSYFRTKYPASNRAPTDISLSFSFVAPPAIHPE